MFFNVIKKSFRQDATPFKMFSFFIFLIIAFLYLSFNFSYYFLLLSIPLLIFTLWALNGFINSLKSDYKREFENKEKEYFETLSISQQEQYIIDNPNSAIALAHDKRKEELKYQAYMNDTISKVQEPKHIKTIEINNILLKEKLTFGVGDEYFEKSFQNQNLECFEWFTKEGRKLSLKEIKEQFKLREKRAYNNQRSYVMYNYRNNSGRGRDRIFKIYNDFCFYEGPPSDNSTNTPIFNNLTKDVFDIPRLSTGYRNSHPFTGKLDNTNYLDGSLII